MDIIRNKFSKHWTEGKYKIEIREANDTLPIGSDMKEVGLTYKGKQYIASLIYEVLDNNNNICKFDIAGINNPETLYNSLSTIKTNLEAKIAKDPSRQAQYQKRIDNLSSDICEKLLNVKIFSGNGNNVQSSFNPNTKSKIFIVGMSSDNWNVERNKYILIRLMK